MIGSIVETMQISCSQNSKKKKKNQQHHGYSNDYNIKTAVRATNAAQD
jgi:hypothetical protein